jgi:hypothetical protein
MDLQSEAELLPILVNRCVEAGQLLDTLQAATRAARTAACRSRRRSHRRSDRQRGGPERLRDATVPTLEDFSIGFS